MAVESNKRKAERLLEEGLAYTSHAEVAVRALAYAVLALTEALDKGREGRDVKLTEQLARGREDRNSEPGPEKAAPLPSAREYLLQEVVDLREQAKAVVDAAEDAGGMTSEQDAQIKTLIGKMIDFKSQAKALERTAW